MFIAGANNKKRTNKKILFLECAGITFHRYSCVHTLLSHGRLHRQEYGGVVSCCLYADVQSPLLPSPHQLLNALKKKRMKERKKESPTPADVYVLFDLGAE